MNTSTALTAVGLMSGTSADGVSAVVARIPPTRRGFRVLAYRTFPYTPRMQRRILALRDATTAEIAEGHVLLGRLFAKAALAVIREAGRRPSDIDVIGSHGQTVFHDPRAQYPATLQLGDPSVIAAATGVAVVADFRSMDVACGGEGAPLVPYFDHYFAGGGAPTLLLNIGGIANVTVVGKSLDATVAFDTGPGNTLIDAAVRVVTGGRMAFDRGGKLAARGTVDERMLRRMMAHPFFRRRPPKSTDIVEFGSDFLMKHAGRELRRRPYDILATLTRLTAQSIAKAIPMRPRLCIVSGGGIFNATLMQFLREELAPMRVESIAAHGLHPLAKEPAAFALLACATLRGIPSNVPSATGARRRAVLGSITRPPKGCDNS